MTKWLSVISALIVGVLLGYATRDLPVSALWGQRSGTSARDAEVSATKPASPQPAGRIESASPTKGGVSNVPAFPATETFLDYVLPERSMAQLRIAMGQIRDNTSEEGIPALFNQEAARDLFAGLSKRAHPSFAPFLGALAANARKVDLFLLPPEADMPVPILLIVVGWPDVTVENLDKSLRDPILAGLENGKSYSRSVGGFTLEGVSADNGNLSYVVTKEGVWICNNPHPLQQIFGEVSPPPAEGDPPLKSLIEHVSEGPVMAAINLRPQPDGRAGPSGLLAWLSSWGIQRIAIRWSGAPPSLVGFGEFKETPDWVSQWPALDMSNLQMSTGGDLAVVDAALPTLPAMDLSRRRASGFSPRNTRGGQGEFGASRGARGESFRAGRGARRSGQRGMRRSSVQRRAFMMARFLPPAQQLSVRLAGGEENPIVWRILFRGEAKTFSEWLNQFEQSSWLHVEDTASGVQRLNFEGGPIPRVLGMNQLFLSERKNTLAIYPNEESSRLLASSAGSAGAVVMEPSSGGKEETRRVHAAISVDFLQMLIQGEKNSLDPRGANTKTVEKLLDALAGRLSPLTVNVTVADDGVGVRIEAQQPLATILGPALITSAFFRGGI